MTDHRDMTTPEPMPKLRMREALEALRRLAQSHAEYWWKITDPGPEHAEMAASQMQHIADALAALSPDSQDDPEMPVGES